MRKSCSVRARCERLARTSSNRAGSSGCGRRHARVQQGQAAGCSLSVRPRAAASGTAYLPSCRQLLAAIGDSRIVMLGESTHGTKEVRVARPTAAPRPAPGRVIERAGSVPPVLRDPSRADAAADLREGLHGPCAGGGLARLRGASDAAHRGAKMRSRGSRGQRLNTYVRSDGFSSDKTCAALRR
jgi:hypothetical protein